MKKEREKQPKRWEIIIDRLKEGNSLCPRGHYCEGCYLEQKTCFFMTCLYAAKLIKQQQTKITKLTYQNWKLQSRRTHDCPKVIANNKKGKLNDLPLQGNSAWL